MNAQKYFMNKGLMKGFAIDEMKKNYNDLLIDIFDDGNALNEIVGLTTTSPVLISGKFYDAYKAKALMSGKGYSVFCKIHKLSEEK